MNNYLKSYIDKHIEVSKLINVESLAGAIELIKITHNSGKKIVTCGNGGSAMTASHYITDWNKSISLSQSQPFMGVSLCDNIGLITAIANDINYEDIFAVQLQAIMNPGDLLIAISGSGNSQNVIKAVQASKTLGCKTLAVVGYDGGNLIKVANQSVHIPSFDMQICEDFHLMFGHMVMKSLCKLPIN